MKLTNRLAYILLFLIILLGSYLRLLNFPNIPPSLNWDEVSIGYNAYSISQTGKDEFGNTFPLYFRSLDDYKQPVYIYLVSATQKVFGYSDFSVRFPSAFFGILSIIVIYFLTLELFKKKEIALLSTLIFSILPWTVQFSRYGLEANVAVFFTTLGILTFLKSLNKKYHLMPISMILFLISTYTYLSYKVTVPLIIISLFLIFFKKINFKNKFVILSVILLLFSFTLIAKDSIKSEGQTRFKGSSILNETNAFNRELDEMLYEGQLGINLPRRFFHEIPIFTNAGLIAKGYFTHFSPNFLFFENIGRLNPAPNTALMYIWMIPFIFIGTYLALRKYDKKNTFVVFSLIIIAPVAASVTLDVPHAIRSFLITVPLTILSALGTYESFIYLKKYKFIQFIFLGFLIIIILLTTWQFQRQYQIHLSHEYSNEWQYGRREMTKYIMENKEKYDKIIVSTGLEWPHIFILYYSKYDPQKYLDAGGTISGSWNSEENKLENLYFHRLNLLRDLKSKEKILFIGNPDDFPITTKPIKIIKYLNGKPAIYFVEN